MMCITTGENWKSSNRLQDGSAMRASLPTRPPFPQGRGLPLNYIHSDYPSPVWPLFDRWTRYLLASWRCAGLAVGFFIDMPPFKPRAR